MSVPELFLAATTAVCSLLATIYAGRANGHAKDAKTSANEATKQVEVKGESTNGELVDEIHTLLLEHMASSREIHEELFRTLAEHLIDSHEVLHRNTRKD